MRLRVPFFPRTIHSQITVIIVLALLIITNAAPIIVRWVRDDYDVLSVEELADRVQGMAAIMAAATPPERATILDATRRSGWRLTLQPLSASERFTTSSRDESVQGWVVEWLFPADSWSEPLGGWKTFLDGERVVAVRVDEETMLVSPLSSDAFDTFLRGDFIGQAPYYLVALITLISLFSAFAVWAITLPLRRIARAAISADISSDAEIFEERGSVEIVALARALNSMHNRILTMVEGRTRMLRGISHDLRTPLTRLRLRAEHLPEGGARDAMLSDINHLDSLLSESLAYLRGNHTRETAERIDVASTLRTICDEFADMGFDVTYRGPNRLIAVCKPLAVTRAITNLCDNARKFGKTAVVELRPGAETMTIDVMDDGPGIPETHRRHVLEPFYKVDAARGGAETGFGLGLSIVAEIVQAHEGKLQLIDRQPHGLIVRLELPIH